MKTRRHRRGYTLIEVMMAVGVMAVGSAALMTMQEASIMANSSSRERTIANSVMLRWLKRIWRDSLMWNLPGAPTAGTIANIPAVGASPSVTDWILPTQEAGTPGSGHGLGTQENYKAGFDGHDLPTTGVGTPFFCTHMRLGWVTSGETIRADVRTFWPRRLSKDTDMLLVTGSGEFEDCAAADPELVTTELEGGPDTAPRLRAVFGSAVVRWTAPSPGDCVVGRAAICSR